MLALGDADPGSAGGGDGLDYMGDDGVRLDLFADADLHAVGQ